MGKMDKLKEKKVLKYVIVGVICFIVGIGAGGSGVSESDYNDLQTKYDESTKKVQELEDKVTEAKPWFDMQENERKAEEERIAKEKKEREDKEKEEAEAKKKAELEAKKKKLSNGKYEVGKDFEAGKYNIIAVSGGGNVICSGAINAIMGPADDGFYQKQYNNITFRNGQVLDIRDVTIELIPVE